MAIPGASQSADDSPIISLIIDVDVPESPTKEQMSEAKSNFYNMTNELSVIPRLYNYTAVAVLDASSAGRLFFASVGLSPYAELAMSGQHSNEKLSDKSFGEQKDILVESMEKLESTKVCGTNEIIVKGFMPQSFDQNDDTYRAQDEVDIEYNMGFQAGILYAPGHEDDVWPYLVEGHNFVAVPVSTVVLSGEKVPLDDRTVVEKGIRADEWYDMLTGKLDDISGNDEPMVVSLSTSISGKGDYLDAFRRFVAYAEENEAHFVKTYDLVAIKGLATTGAYNWDCPTCNSGDSDIEISSPENNTIVM